MGRMRLLTGILCPGQRVHFYTLNDTDAHRCDRERKKKEQSNVSICDHA